MRLAKLTAGYEKKFFTFLEELQKKEFYPALEVKAINIVLYPWRKQRSEEILFITPAVIVFVENVLKESFHVVVYAWNEEEKEWTVFCGDALLGKSEAISKTAVYKSYVDFLKKVNLAEYKIPESYIGVSDFCSFWINKDCKHIKHATTILLTLGDNKKREIENTLSQIREKANGKKPERKNLSQILKKFAFKVPVLIEGEQGSGKTYTAFKVAEELANELGAEVIVGQGDNSVEATDLLGYWIKDRSGLVWKDGVLTESFRKAQRGKVILIFDEFYRLKEREKDIFVRALTVFPDGKLRLRTGRVVKVEDGIAVEEIIEIPKENLWVIATTNVGTQFAVDEADPALKERFIIIRKDTSEEELREILIQKVQERGFSETLVDKLIRFYRGAEKLTKSGELASKPTTRTLVRAVELSESEEEVKEYLWEQRYLWIGRDSFGYPIPEQEEILRDLIDSIF